MLTDDRRPIHSRRLMQLLSVKLNMHLLDDLALMKSLEVTVAENETVSTAFLTMYQILRKKRRQNKLRKPKQVMMRGRLCMLIVNVRLGLWKPRKRTFDVFSD